MPKWTVWPRCPGDWLRVNGIYLVSPGYEKQFRRLAPVKGNEGRLYSRTVPREIVTAPACKVALVSACKT